MWQWTSITVCPSVVEAQPNVEWRRGSHDANVPGPETDNVEWESPDTLPTAGVTRGRDRG